ncbi:MAG TPA: hypothetical protein VH859_01990 [Candidatus Limnocylindria bacterium]
MASPRSRIGGFHLALIPALAFALILAACSPDAAAPGGDGAPSLRVTVPQDGTTVSTPFEVAVETGAPIGPPETGSHHVHLYFDTDTSSPDYDLVYETPFQVTRDLAPGEHTVIASLRNPDHSDAGVSQTFTITVGEVAGDDGGATGIEAAPSSVLPDY